MCVSRLSRILLGAWRNNNNSSMNIPKYHIKVMCFTSSVLEAGVRKSHRKGLTHKNTQSCEWKGGLKQHADTASWKQAQNPALLWLPGFRQVGKLSPDRLSLPDPPPPRGGDTGWGDDGVTGVFVCVSGRKLWVFVFTGTSHGGV